LYSLLENRLSRLATGADPSFFAGSKTGLEKESLRVNPEGSISQTPHPSVLGSALTNPYITTDYSEALIEFITPPFARSEESLQFLQDTQQFVYSRLDNELLWATSMPCVVAGETSIPIAQYGSSNAGLMKTVYRRGLGHRYGRVMQVIAGVHYNYSFADTFWPVYQEQEKDSRLLQTFISKSYFALIRNLQRYGWLIPYLFGASPAVCKSFLGGQPTTLKDFDDNTYYEPFATSLRMGDIGYQNNKENETGVNICYDSLENYIKSLASSIDTPCPEYEKIGVKVNGEYRQLNANILQIENEYYSTIRPKQVLSNNEKPTLALKKRGVRYVELRSLDVNAFEPLGIGTEQLYFLEILMTFCLLQDSPQVSTLERKEINHNEIFTAHHGRDPSLQLQRNGDIQSLKSWAQELCEQMTGVCEFLDTVNNNKYYTRALKAQMEVVADPDRTPSAIMLDEMRKEKEGFYHYAKRMSEKHHRYFRSLSENKDRTGFFIDAASESLEKQRAIEAADSMTFEQYLQNYFSQT